ASARCAIACDALSTGELDGVQVAKGVVAAWAFADADPYRAATHNKGVMNGIDAVLLATGNDWRAIEAGAHAYAARGGCYRSLTRWSISERPHPNPPPHAGEAAQYLIGQIELPMAIGTVGGMTRVHPTARAAMKPLDVQSAQELAGVMGAGGLAQTFDALRGRAP